MIHSFWCDKCKKDFDSPAHKAGNSYAQWWETKCPKGHKSLRYITDRLSDPYFHKSAKLREQRKMFAKDLIQPGDPGYKTAYPEQARKMEEEEEKAYTSEIDRKKYYDALYKKHAWNFSGRAAVRAAEAAEYNIDGTNR